MPEEFEGVDYFFHIVFSASLFQGWEQFEGVVNMINFSVCVAF